MPTTNPVPSTDPSDLLFNAGRLDEVVNGTSNSFTDRLGVARRTVAGMNADFDAQLADAESDLNVYRADAAASAAEALGYLQTIRATSYGAYAEDPTTDPLGNPPTVGDEYFNTTANLLKRWNGTTWQASDINTANLAASSGSSLVGYTSAGGGAVATTVQQQLRNIQSWSVNVKDSPFYAKGDGVSDDTEAISKAVRAVSAAGGGEVRIPGGTYLIRKRALAGLPDATKYYFLPLCSNVTLRGDGMGISVLKVDDGNGDYHRVFRVEGVEATTQVNNTAFFDFTIDANSNGTGNGITNSSTMGFANNARVEFAFGAGSNATFERVEIVDSSSFNSILAYNLWAGGLTVRNCKFLEMGDDANHITHDSSCVLSTCGPTIITNNTFSAKTIDKAAFSPIELGAGDAVITENIIKNYHYGVLIASTTAPTCENIVVSNNRISGVRGGFYLWSVPPNSGSHPSQTGLKNIQIHDNIVDIWNTSYSKTDGNGAYVRNTAGCYIITSSTYDVEGLSVKNNTFSFKIETATTEDNLQTFGVGWNIGSPGITVKDTTISGNKILNSPGPAISLYGAEMANVTVDSNEITNPAHSPAACFAAVPLYMYPIHCWMRSGTSYDVDVRNNKVIDYFSTSKVKGLASVYKEIAANVSNMSFIGNTVRAVGSTKTSLVDYVYVPSAGINPLVDGEFDNFLASAGATLYYAGGSRVLDRVNNRVWEHTGVGTNWGVFKAKRTSAPTTLYWPRGSIVENYQPSAGVIGRWSCTASGTPGTWIPDVLEPGMAASRGDTDVTLTAGADAPTQRFGTPLTANRTVTLDTASAWAGARFRIVRLASATGAFSLNVGVGPLKSLTASGQWCDVEYSGSSWWLVASGTL